MTRTARRTRSTHRHTLSEGCQEHGYGYVSCARRGLVVRGDLVADVQRLERSLTRRIVRAVLFEMLALYVGSAVLAGLIDGLISSH